MKDTLEYFGTNLTEHGHYRFILDDTYMQKNYKEPAWDLPFHPEHLTNNLPKGETVFYQGGGFTVFGIAGSCKDQRGGTKTIFWVKNIITKAEIIQQIRESIPAMKIINAITFPIKW